MKLLIIGAGVLGSVLASRLFRAKFDVTLLVRKHHYEKLINDGILIHYLKSGEQTKDFIPVVTEIDDNEGSEHYDYIFVIMQKNQAINVAKTLSILSYKPHIVFLGNNGTNIDDYTPPLDPSQILLGFMGASGYRNPNNPHIIDSGFTSESNIILGELDGFQSSRLIELKQIFEQTGIIFEIQSNIDAWLKSHLALIIPLAMGIYAAGGDNVKMANSTILMNKVIEAIREGFQVLKTLNIPIVPKKIPKMMLLPKFLLRLLTKKALAGDVGKTNIAAHANAAKQEMVQLACEFELLMNQANISTPALDFLYQYRDPEFSPIVP